MKRPVRLGPRITTKLLLLALALLAVPLLVYQYSTQMRSSIFEAQEHAQLLAARAIGTVLQNRKDLFDDGVGLPGGALGKAVLNAHPLDHAIVIDGYAEDWREVANLGKQYAANDSPDDLSFDLVFATRGDYLYGLLQVTDDQLVYRHPRYRRLDNSDHIRLSLEDAQGKTRRYILTTAAQGTVSTYEMQHNWRFPVDGRPVNSVWGEWLETGAGQYQVEFRLPLAMLGPTRALSLAVADVDNFASRKVSNIASTLPAGLPGAHNRVLVRSPQLERILHALKNDGSRIWIIDRDRRIRASAMRARGEVQQGRATLSRYYTPIGASLKGVAVTRRFPGAKGATDTIVATTPILVGDTVHGVVLVEQAADTILAGYHASLRELTLQAAIVFLVIVVGLFLFSARLTWRIGRLSHEAAGTIDPQGRLLANAVHADARSADEIGDLSRSITGMLARLQPYTQYLERLARMLRHEINNPLNTISTSLDNLSDTVPETARSDYMERAKRGVGHISELVEKLSDAANLEEALKIEERDTFDLAAFTWQYTQKARQLNPEHVFEVEIPDEPIYIHANETRIDEMLNKLVENAVDFSPPSDPITLALEQEDGQARLHVINHGPELPPGAEESIFNPLYTDRPATPSPNAHLGIGLHVARIIAEGHNGTIHARNCNQLPGVDIAVALPEKQFGRSAPNQ